MKGAAKCDKHCELQNSVNQQGLERTLRFRDIPESMPASVSTPHTAGDAALWASHLSVLCVRVPRPLTHVEQLVSSRRATYQASCMRSVAACVAVALAWSARGTFSRHEVRSANPLNLSI